MTIKFLQKQMLFLLNYVLLLKQLYNLRAYPERKKELLEQEFVPPVPKKQLLIILYQMIVQII